MANKLVAKRENGVIAISLERKVSGGGKDLALAEGKPSDGGATLAKTNAQVLGRKTFALLVEGLRGGELAGTSTKLEMYQHITSPGMLAPEDYLSAGGKPLKHVYKYIDGTPMMGGKPLSRNSAFSSMVQAYVASDAFLKVWKAANRFYMSAEEGALAKIGREGLEAAYGSLPVSSG